jgi:hypothetical protein
MYIALLSLKATFQAVLAYKREFVTGNEIPCIVAHRCIIVALTRMAVAVTSQNRLAIQKPTLSPITCDFWSC